MVKVEEIKGVGEKGRRLALLGLLEERDRRVKGRRLGVLYPEKGSYRRGLYPRHLAFFRAGRDCKERCVMAANRVGKTEGIGAFETALHLTGLYPDWWEGKRFTGGILAWVCGDTGQTTRDTVQVKLLGRPSEVGTGLIPLEYIKRVVPKPGVPDGVAICEVRNVGGEISRVVFKSYDQGRESFAGAEVDVVWEDEEPPPDVHIEATMRTMTTNGIVLVTYTPELGLSETASLFMGGEDVPESPDGRVNGDGRFIINIQWDHVPHLTEEMKRDELRRIPPYHRDAKSKGLPRLGAGAIYPIPEAEITVEDFKLPDHWLRAYALDVGWNFTAALWGAVDPGTGVTYVYSVYKKGEAEPSAHAAAIRARGELPGVVDPAARSRSQKDGESLLQSYKDLGLLLTPADNAVDSGLGVVWDLLVSKKLRVFRSCTELFQEYRIYHRDKKGKLVKANDHLMDCLRYFCMSGRQVATVPMGGVIVQRHAEEEEVFGRKPTKRRSHFV